MVQNDVDFAKKRHFAHLFQAFTSKDVISVDRMGSYKIFVPRATSFLRGSRVVAMAGETK